MTVQLVTPTSPTTTQRPIEGIYQAPGLHWVGDGFRVAGYFSHIPDAVEKLSPFLLLDYNPPHQYSPTDKPRGVGVHPHRGFETVTIAWEGSVAHHDSAGGGGVIGPGDVQWMTAASGVLHKEYHEREFSKRGGLFHMAQLWVNLPRAHKMGPPRYQPLTASQMGHVQLPQGAGEVRVIAGEYLGARGPALTYSPVHVYDARLHERGAASFGLPAAFNVAVLVMEGELTLGGAHVKSGDFVIFERTAGAILAEAHAEAHLLVLAGEPIDEPVVQYGPFVMNTREEILEAFADYNRGAFGSLED